MAEYMNEPDKAKEYRELFEKGKKWVDRNLFNGDYYHQKININDKSILQQYAEGLNSMIGDISSSYWNDEHKELNFQIGEGCGIDQVIAQWHANINGLGEIFDRKQVKKSLKSLYKNNFKKSMRNFYNACRIYALNGESGIVICDWPEGKYKPMVPLTYNGECMNGFEYAAGIHMIQEGLVKEGLEIVKAVRDRYNGENRNPWNEFECGSNYARSMASYALLPALSGFEFDMVKKHIGFAPVISEKSFQCFWSLDCGWGIYQRKGNKITLKVLSGSVNLKSYSDSLFLKQKKVKITIAGKQIFDFIIKNNTVIFKEIIEINNIQQLIISV